MPDMSGPLISLYEFARDEGWVTEKEFVKKKRQILFESYVGVPVIAVGILAWAYVIAFLVGA